MQLFAANPAAPAQTFHSFPLLDLHAPASVGVGRFARLFLHAVSSSPGISGRSFLRNIVRPRSPSFTVEISLALIVVAIGHYVELSLLSLAYLCLIQKISSTHRKGMLHPCSTAASIPMQPALGRPSERHFEGVLPWSCKPREVASARSAAVSVRINDFAKG